MLRGQGKRGETAPLSDKNEICGELELTAEAEALLYKLGNSPVDDFPDMRDALKRIRAVACLSSHGACCA